MCNIAQVPSGASGASGARKPQVKHNGAGLSDNAASCQRGRIHAAPTAVRSTILDIGPLPSHSNVDG